MAFFDIPVNFIIQKLKSKHLVSLSFLWCQVFLREREEIFSTYSGLSQLQSVWRKLFVQSWLYYANLIGFAYFISYYLNNNIGHILPIGISFSKKTMDSTKYQLIISNGTILTTHCYKAWIWTSCTAPYPRILLS